MSTSASEVRDRHSAAIRSAVFTRAPARQALPTRGLLFTSLSFAAFVVYGSLVPLDFQARPWAEAWHVFMTMPYLQLGPNSRQDWTANLLLYIPISFCAGLALLDRSRTTVEKIAWCTTIFVVSFLLSIGVEFAQIYFPPRTVSLNDITAQTIGTIIGLGFCWAAMDKAVDVWQHVAAGGRSAIRASLYVYTVAYVAICLFPYDVVWSRAELLDKLQSGAIFWSVSPSACELRAVCAAKLSFEAIAAIPLGVLAVFARRTLSPWVGFVRGALLGLAIEGFQVFLVSGVSQGASILTRGIGVALGVAALPLFRPQHVEFLRRHARVLVALAVIPYCGAFALANGVQSGGYLSVADALARLQDVRFIPFYYHYYTSEYVAFFSLLKVSFLYAPIGVALWMWKTLPTYDGSQAHVALAAWVAGSLALVAESAKLFIRSQHPDPTNLLIASIAAPIAWRCCIQITTWASDRAAAAHPAATLFGTGTSIPGAATRASAAQPAASSSAPANGPAAEETASRWFRGTIIGAGLICVAAATVTYPSRPFLLLLALLAYAYLLAMRPFFFLTIIPALLPVLNLAPWSGRFFFDEFDFFVATTLIVAFPMTNKNAEPAARFSNILRAALIAYFLCYGVSVIKGLLPLSPLDSNAFANYYSHYAALRAAKGILFGVALGALALRGARAGVDVVCDARTGFLIGAAAVVGIVLWERSAAVGVLDWVHDYRITAMFSEMHIGGVAVDAYLAAVLPFAFYAMAIDHGLRRFLAMLVCIGTIYAVIVTYSRGAYVAAAAGVFILGALLIIASKRARISFPTVASITIAMIAALALFAAAFGGGYIKDRVENSRADAAARFEHWRDSLDLVDSSWPHRIFGVGVGRYPEAFFWHHTVEQRLPTYRYGADDKKPYLRLGGGALYMNQAVDVEPFNAYRLNIELRGHGDGSAVNVDICGKWLLYSRDCQSTKVHVRRHDGAWERQSATLTSATLGSGSWWNRLPVKLSLSNPNMGTEVDIGRIALTDRNGRDLVTNGDFAEGNDHWLFTTDEHLQWHADNLVVHVIIEQGFVGLLATLLVVVIIFRIMLADSLKGDTAAGVLVASLAGVLVVGILGSVVDVPRISLLVALLCGLGIARSYGTRSPRGRF